MELGFAAVNVVFLGGFATVSKGALGITKLGHLIGGEGGRAAIRAVTEVLTRWPVATINQVASWRLAGEAVADGERVTLSTTRAIVPVGAVDGWYARVLPRSAAEKFATGGAFTRSVPGPAFIAERQAVRGLSSRSGVARRPGLINADGSLRDLADHVVVEFRFASNEPLVNLSSPFGEVGSHGPGFLPGGFSSAGVREWVVDTEATSKGMIDLASLTIRELPHP